MPVNALLGATNAILRIVADQGPRAVVICSGAEAARYRVERFAGYHADRPPVPEGLALADRPLAAAVRGARLDARRDAGPGGRRPPPLVRAGGGRGRRDGDADDRRPRHVPVRRAGRGGALPEDRRQRVRADGAGGGQERYGVPPAWCRTSSPCAGTRPTGCRAREGSARRAPPTCCAPRFARGRAGVAGRREAARRDRAARAGGRAARLPRDRDAPAGRRRPTRRPRDRPRRRRSGGRDARDRRLAERLRAAGDPSQLDADSARLRLELTQAAAVRSAGGRGGRVRARLPRGGAGAGASAGRGHQLRGRAGMLLAAASIAVSLLGREAVAACARWNGSRSSASCS